LLEWVARDSYEFKKASCVSKYSFSNPYAFCFRSYYAPFWCDFCNFFDHDINSCPYYACYTPPYLTSPWDNTDVVLSLHDSSFPLAQCMELEMGKPYRIVARFDVGDACFKSEDILDEVHDLDETPLEGSRDVFMHKDFPSPDFNNIVLPNPLDHSYVSPICSEPSFSLEYSLDMPIENPKICDSNVDLGHEVKMFNMLGGNIDNFLSLGYFCGYEPSLDPYSMHLMDKLRKIMWNTFLDSCFDFSIGFALLKRALTFVVVIIFTLSYCHAWKLYAQEFD